MSHRRGFLKAMAGATGIVAAGCSLLERRWTSCKAGAGRRRQVTVNGRRVKTIDVHSHCAVPEALALMQIARRIFGPLGQPAAFYRSGPSADHGRAGHRRRGAQHQPVLVRGRSHVWPLRSFSFRTKSYLALCAAYPGRFVAFATVALQHPDLAAQQLEDGKKLGLRGAAIGGNINGEELSSPRFDPFWAKAEQLGALIFIHPQGIPELQKRFQGNGYLSNVIWQSAGDYHRSVAPDFRRHARPVSQSQDLRRARRRISALLLRAVRPWLRHFSRRLQSQLY